MARRGYNDIFYAYPQSAYALARTGNANLVRLNVYWNAVQSAPGQPFNFGPGYGGVLSALINTPGLKVLPVLLGSLYPGEPFPTSSQAQTDFGTFAVETCKYFNQNSDCNFIDAVEVWNEPNGAANVPVGSFINLCRAVSGAVNAANNGGQFATTKKVVSGGIQATGPYWENYWYNVVSGANYVCTYDLGLHPYYAYQNKPTNRADYVNLAVNQTLSKYDYAFNTKYSLGVSNGIWVTEVGATSQQPWGQAGQDDALQQIAHGLRNRPSMEAMIVHRLYSDNTLPGEQSGQTLYHCAVCEDGTLAPKTAYYGLQSRWSGWG